jgi:uncharacterized damage-inducible protein DinB
MQTRDLMLTAWGGVRTGLIATVEKFGDDELGFRALPRGYSAAETVLHIAQEEDGEVRYGMTRELAAFPDALDAARYPSAAALVAALGDVHARTLAYVQGLNDADLAADVETPWGLTRPLGELLWHVLEHEVHHRGELSLMLGMLGREGLDA